MKATPGRVRIFKALAKPGAFAKADGYVPIRYADERPVRINANQLVLFERIGLISRAYDEPGLISVFRITDAGKEWIRRNS